MSWIQLIDPDRATGELRDIYNDIASARGGIADVHRVQSLNARVLRSVTAFVPLRRRETTRRQPRTSPNGQPRDRQPREEMKGRWRASPFSQWVRRAKSPVAAPLSPTNAVRTG